MWHPEPHSPHDGSHHLSASEIHLLLHPTEEKDDEALRDNDNVLCLNVGGKRHWAMCKNFVNFPGTRLGRLARARNGLNFFPFRSNFICNSMQFEDSFNSLSASNFCSS